MSFDTNANEKDQGFFNNRFIFAFIFSFGILYGFDFIFGKYFKSQRTQNSEINLNQVNESKGKNDYKSNLISDVDVTEDSINVQKFKIENDKIHFYVSSSGVIDTVIFNNYNENPDKQGSFLNILSNKKELNNFKIDLLNDKSLVFKKSSKNKNSDISLFYADKNNQIVSKIDISLYDKYLIKVKKTNLSDNYSLSSSSKKIRFLMYDNFSKKNKSGIHGYIDNEVLKFDKNKIIKSKIQKKHTIEEKGWFGFYEKYSLVTLLNDLENDFNSNIKYDKSVISLNFESANNSNNSNEFTIYAGPRKYSIINEIQKDLNIKILDRSIDFGFFYFLTKPLLIMLNNIYKYTHNYGLAIIFLTILVKLTILPLSNKSYSSMAKMSSLGPKISDLKKRITDPVQQQKSIIDLYKKHEVSPLSGCLPLLIQIPLFFALYKLFDTSIDIRNEKFLWIKDLSEQDHLSVFNLFGLIKINLPAFLNIGILPVLMSLSMYIQQLMSTKKKSEMTEQELMNKKIMLYFIPIFMCFVFAGVASGLVLYWTVSNVFSIINQYIVQKKNGNKMGN